MEMPSKNGMALSFTIFRQVFSKDFARKRSSGCSPRRKNWCGKHWRE